MKISLFASDSSVKAYVSCPLRSSILLPDTGTISEPANPELVSGSHTGLSTRQILCPTGKPPAWQFAQTKCDELAGSCEVITLWVTEGAVLAY
jgi:hypothetical protein